MRRTPRIISRSRRFPASARFQERNETLVNDVDDGLGEGLIVQGGVMMHVSDLNDLPSTSSSNGLQKKFSQRSGLNASNWVYIKDPPTPKFLPDIANDVESYPCEYCANRIFLTAAGLERHARSEHPDHIHEVLKKIAEISDEWRRRELEKKKYIEQALVKNSLNSRFNRVESVRFDRNENISASEQNYEPCSVCGILINVLHPSAMINHIRAHSKNDQLRDQLLAEYGPECVARLTCSECQSVFSDEKKLIAHINFSHSRKKMYICKWCGHVCQSMGALNHHKTFIHGILSKDRDDLRKQCVKGFDHMCSTISPHSGEKDNHLSSKHGATNKYFLDKASTREDLHCRTTCEVCGLSMSKPSLLIRHMLRVHNRSSFTAIVEIKTLDPIKIEVIDGKITWWCCNAPFYSRAHFIDHRRAAHRIRYDFAGYVNDSRICERENNGIITGENSDLHQEQSQECAVSLLQESVVPDNPDNVFFVLVSDDNNSDGDKQDICWENSDLSVSPGTQHVTLSAEQYEQLRLQVNGNMDNMQIIFLEDDTFIDQLENQRSGGLMLAEPLMESVSHDDPLGSAFLHLDHDPNKTRNALTSVPVPGISVTVHSNP